MTRWVAELRNRDDIIETQVRNWFAEISGQRQRLDLDQYPALAKLAPRFVNLQEQLELASALPEAIVKYEAVKAHEAVMPSVLEDLLDDILDRLVTEYDEEELPLKREVIFHEAVISEGGDLTRATAQANELQLALEETNDVVSLQTVAAISPEKLGVSTQTQRIAIGVGASDFRSAVSRYTAAYRSAAVADLDLVLRPDHSSYAATYGFPSTTISSTWEEVKGIQVIESSWKSAFDSFIDKLRFKSSWYVMPALIALGVAVVFLAVAPLAGVIAAAVGGALVILLGEQRKRSAQTEIDKVEEVRQAAVADSVLLYRDALAQLVDAHLLYDELDSQEGELVELIEAWPTIDHSNEVRA